MKHQEIAGLMGSLAPVIGEFVSKAMAPLRAENERLKSSLSACEQGLEAVLLGRQNDNIVFINLIKEEVAKIEIPTKEIDPVEIERVVTEKVEKAVSAIPVPENGKDAEPVDLDEVASRAAKLLPVPENGKDASPEAIKAAVLDIVAEILPGEVSSAVDKIEKPKDGKDVDPVEIAALVSAEVSKAIGAIERPADGKSVTVDDVRPLLEEMVAALPVPENGRDVDPEAVRSMVVDEVSKIERPKDGQDGKSVDIQDLIPVIVAEVENAIAAVDPPKDGEPGTDGKSITAEDVRPMLEEMVSAIEPAKDGKDADPTEIAALIIEDVAKLIPIPADGKGVTVEDVMPAIHEMIAEKFSEIAKPKDGVDGADVVDLLIDHAGMLVATLSNGKTKTLGPIVGKDAEIEPLERMIEEKLESIQATELDKTTVAKFVEQELERISKDFRKSDDFVPDDVASNVALVVKMMAETPKTQVQKEMQPINVYSDVRLPEMKFPETVVNVTVPEQQAPVVNMAAPIVNVEPAKVEMPKRGKEVTTVKTWTKDGRIASFEKHEVEDD